LKIQQLLSAEDSPVSPVEKQDIPSFPKIPRKSDRTAFDRIEFYFREMITCIKELAINARHFILPSRLLML
jgi:hypothetical protein